MSVALVRSERDSLDVLEDAARSLGEVRSVRDAKRIMDLADLHRRAARQMDLGREVEIRGHALFIDAKCLHGELLQEMPDAPDGWSARSSSSDLKPEDRTPTLSDLGVTKKLSSESQQLARLRAEHPDAYEALRRDEISETKARSLLRQPKTPEPFHLLTARGDFCDAVLRLIETWPAKFRKHLPEALRELADEIEEESCL